MLGSAALFFSIFFLIIIIYVYFSSNKRARGGKIIPRRVETKRVNLRAFKIIFSRYNAVTVFSLVLESSSSGRINFEPFKLLTFLSPSTVPICGRS